MRDFIVKLLGLLVNNSEEVVVLEKQEGPLSSFDMSIPAQEIGRVIGKNGNIIRAIRALVQLKAKQENRQVVIRLLEPNQDQAVLP